MWQLLQKLENLWWKPYWKSIAELSETEKNVRLLTSLSSWLWQFVCENGIVKKNSNDDKYNSRQKNMYNSYQKRDRAYAKYRLIESALCDEDKLEQFLLDNIKIDE